MFNPDSEEERILFLLNSFAGAVNRGPWTVQRSTQYHMDEFGESIRAGDTYYVRRSGGTEFRRLSSYSAHRIWELLIADNGRQEEFRQSMLQMQHEQQRAEAEAEAETYEDLQDR